MILPFTIGSMKALPIFPSDIHCSDILRYGENPHQSGVFFGDFEQIFDKLQGKAISYNNLVDIDAAVQLMREFQLAKSHLRNSKTHQCLW